MQRHLLTGIVFDVSVACPLLGSSYGYSIRGITVGYNEAVFNITSDRYLVSVIRGVFARCAVKFFISVHFDYGISDGSVFVYGRHIPEQFLPVVVIIQFYSDILVILILDRMTVSQKLDSYRIRTLAVLIVIVAPLLSDRNIYFANGICDGHVVTFDGCSSICILDSSAVFIYSNHLAYR